MQRLATSIAFVFGALTATAPAGAQPAESTPAPLAATEIYDRARAAVRARSVPSYIAYTQFVTFARHGRTRTQNERIVVRLSDGAASVRALDHPGAAAQVEPHPLVFPTSTFGLVERHAGELPSAMLEGGGDAPSPTAPGPRVIGRVNASARPYDLSFAGIEALDGAPVYHIAAIPRFDPSRNRIRALYVDTATFEPRRIVFEYFAARGPLRSRPTVTVDYTRVDGTWVIAHAALDFVVRFGFFSYGGNGELRITDVSFPAAEPASMFDPAAPAGHPHTARP